MTRVRAHRVEALLGRQRELSAGLRVGDRSQRLCGSDALPTAQAGRVAGDGAGS